jgi:hypothetical protein
LDATAFQLRGDAKHGEDKLSRQDTAGISAVAARNAFDVRRIEFRANRHEVRRSCRAALIEEVRFARDSPLEEDGFEPSVPRGRERTSRAKSDLQDDNRRRSIRQAE